MKTSTDLFFCAYLNLKGHNIHSYDVIQRGKISCSFDISDENWKKHKIEFNNSEFAKLKQLIEQLKDLSF